MKNLTRALLLASMLIPSGAGAQQAGMTDSDRKAIINEIISYFVNNPEALLGKAPPPAAPAEPFAGAAADPSSGPADAPYTVMVFSDYGCGPCNDVERMLDGLAARRGDVRIVHRDYPVSGEDAVAASMDVIAAFNANPRADWMALRRVLLEKGVAPEYRIEALAAAGIDGTAEMPASVKLAILKNRELARRAGVKTLPAVIVMRGEGIVPIAGAVTEAGLETAIGLLSGTP